MTRSTDNPVEAVLRAADALEAEGANGETTGAWLVAYATFCGEVRAWREWRDEAAAKAGYRNAV